MTVTKSAMEQPGDGLPRRIPICAQPAVVPNLLRMNTSKLLTAEQLRKLDKPGRSTMRWHGSIIRMLAGSIIPVLSLALMAGAATSDFSTTPDPRDKINIWEGRWKEQVETKETPYSHAASVPSHTTCSWSADRGYMVCEYLSEKTDPAEGRASDHLTIFTYDEKGKAYKHLGISKDYKTLEEATTIEGNLWHYSYQLPGDKGEKLDLRDSYEFVTPEKRITRIEVSADGGQHWTLLSESVATKVH